MIGNTLLMFAGYFLFLSSTVKNMSYSRYCNERFGFCIEYPSSFIGKGESFNKDGEIFISNDGRAEIRAFGGRCDKESLTFSNELNWATEGMIVTYKLIGKSSFIISGMDSSGKIVYRKTVNKKVSNTIEGTGPVFQTLMITYLAADSNTYKEYCHRIATSFK